jgi:hypothetical protein
MTHPRGRQAIGLNQPPNSGNLYPFVNPSSDIQQLFSDFFVSFENSSGSVKHPLKVAWLYGFGSNSVSPFPGRPTPSHAYDLIVEDANGEIVFDSTEASVYKAVDWDSRLRVIEWESDMAVCRCVIHTQWTQEDVTDGLAIMHDDNIEPENGELYAECGYELPRRVKSIQIGNEIVTAKALTLQSGYNFAMETVLPIEVESPAIDLFGEVGLIEGSRRATKIQLSAEPGSGLGVFPGCVDTATVLRTLNKVRSDSHNNFTLDSEGCIRQHRPLSLSSTTPRVFSYSASAMSTSQAAATIKLSNDCRNCCDCEYYARTYQGLKRQWSLYKDIAHTAEEARDFYRDNKDRWLVEKAMREKDFIRVSVATDADCKVRWGVAVCNPTNCCLINLKIQVFFLPYVFGGLSYGVNAFHCPDTYLEGSSTCQVPVAVSPEILDSENHVHLYTVDYADPQSMTLLYGKQCLPSCYDEPGNTSVAIAVVAYWENQAPVGSQCKPVTNIATDLVGDIVSFCGLASIPVPTEVYGQALSQKREMLGSTSSCLSCNCQPEI